MAKLREFGVEVEPWQVVTSFVVFAVIYAVLATVALRLLIRYAKAGPPPDKPRPAVAKGAERQLTFAY